MTNGAFIGLLGMILGGVLGVLVVLGLVVLALHFVDDRFNGIPQLRRELAARGLAPSLVELVAQDVSLHAPSVAWPALIAVAGLGGLGVGVQQLSAMYAPTTEELALYPAPGLVLVVLGLVSMVRNVARRGRSGPLYRALVTDAVRTRLVVSTSVHMLVDDTRLGEALTGTRAAVWRDIPHVILVTEGGDELRLRHDHDPSLPAAVRGALPHARATSVVTGWREGMGRALLEGGAGAPSHA